MWIDRQQPHPSDQELLDWYFDHPGNGEAGRPLSPHMAACSTCAQRYAELARELDLLAVEGEHEADALFTPEILAVQRQHVMRRIETEGFAEIGQLTLGVGGDVRPATVVER